MAIFSIIPSLNSRGIKYISIPGSNGELVMVCPVCGKEDHFYFNYIKNKGICHKCKWECGAVSYLIVGLGLSKKDALRLAQGSRDVSTSSMLSRVEALKNKVENSSELIDDLLYFKNPLPDKVVDITKDKFPVVFKERGISKELALQYNPKMCNARGKFFNRIIFPIKTLKNETFTAITALTRSKFRKIKETMELEGRHYRKSLFPQGSLMSETLFDYDRIKDIRGRIVVVEGIWDFLKLRSHSINATCSFGDKISLRQAYLLSETKATHIYIMLDGDVDIKRLETYHKMVSNICFDKEIRTCVLPKDKDPDELSKKELKDAFFFSRIRFFGKSMG